MKKFLCILGITISLACFADEDIPADYIPENLPQTPSEVYVTAPQSQQEGNVGTVDRYGEEFDAFILKKYPDIKKQKFVPDSTMRDDKEVFDMSKSAFIRALYFSKIVTMASGQSLYDYLTKCAKLNRTVTSADRTSGDTNEFYIQYFFELKKPADSKLVGESIYLKRQGDKFLAMKTPFAYFALSDKDFMRTYGLTCIK